MLHYQQSKKFSSYSRILLYRLKKTAGLLKDIYLSLEGKLGDKNLEVLKLYNNLVLVCVKLFQNVKLFTIKLLYSLKTLLYIL